MTKLTSAPIAYTPAELQHLDALIVAISVSAGDDPYYSTPDYWRDCAALDADAGDAALAAECLETADELDAGMMGETI